MLLWETEEGTECGYEEGLLIQLSMGAINIQSISSVVFFLYSSTHQPWCMIRKADIRWIKVGVLTSSYYHLFILIYYLLYVGEYAESLHRSFN